MINLKKKKIPDADIPAGPMADISFLLLLFFLVSSNIDVDTGIGLTLPEYVEGPQKTTKINPERMASLNINQNGDVLLGGQVIAIPQIKKNLKERIAQKIDLEANKKLIVSVKTDRKTNYNLYIQTLDQVKGAFFEVREEYALGKWGKKVIDLGAVENDELKEKIPIIISIAEPETIK